MNTFKEFSEYRKEEMYRLAEIEEQYSQCDPDWFNVENAASKGIISGARWFAKRVAENIHKGCGAAGLLQMCDEIMKD